MPKYYLSTRFSGDFVQNGVEAVCAAGVWQQAGTAVPFAQTARLLHTTSCLARWALASGYRLPANWIHMRAYRSREERDKLELGQ